MNNIKKFENFSFECDTCYDSKEVLCPDCYNTGNNDNCQVCQGKGYITCSKCKEEIVEENKSEDSE